MAPKARSPSPAAPPLPSAPPEQPALPPQRSVDHVDHAADPFAQLVLSAVGWQLPLTEDQQATVVSLLGTHSRAATPLTSTLNAETA